MVALVATTLTLLAPGATASTTPAPSGPDVDPITRAIDQSPPGSNDWSCRPSAAHPEPVVLVHGTGANQAVNWTYLSPVLAREGYCVFSLTYGRNPLAPPPLTQAGGLVPMERSAPELRDFVERVLAATGAKQVDIVGHSQGSLMPNQYVRFLDGAEKVKRYVGVTPLWDGTRLAGLDLVERLGRASGLDAGYGPLLATACGSCRQFVRGSEFLQRMNSDGGPAEEGVDYTMILTRNDEVVVPFTSGLLDGAENVVLQDVCPADPSGHAAIILSPNTAQIILNALDPERDKPVRCGAQP